MSETHGWIRHVLVYLTLVLAAACTTENPDYRPSAESNTTSDNPAASRLTACPSTNVIEDPADFEWTYQAPTNGGEGYYVGTMEIGEHTFEIGGETLTTRLYRQAGTAYSFPGPTMRLAPGNKYVLRFHNTLPFEPLSDAHNDLKDPNVSNLHTHGVHISGESPGDDVTRSFEGGYGGDFVYDIPDDHMGGSYWYHAHHHGSTFLQVAGGALGMMVIDDARDGIPANVEAMEERELLIAYLNTDAAGAGGDTLLQGTLQPTWTVNGKVRGNLCMPTNEWQHWRILLADVDAREKTVAVGANCEVALMARDGVWRTKSPKMLPAREISLTGASRADLAVRCQDDSEITVAGETVAHIYADGPGDTSVHPFKEDGSSQWSAIRPTYLRELRGVARVNSEKIRMGARTINGSKFDINTPTFTMNADQVQHWEINGAQNHPFHLHVYHVQSQDCGGDFEPGEYYDTISTNCAVRFDLNAATSTPYEGMTLMHCHILEHEDQGAMGWIDVVGGQPPPTFPAGSEHLYSEYYALDGTAVCGDGVCDSGETSCTCASDCGAPAALETVCSDGVDNDCDGLIDCADKDCSGDIVCAPDCDNDSICETGEDCENCPGDCDGLSKGKPDGRYCCGDGVLQPAEGDGAICDGNP